MSVKSAPFYWLECDGCDIKSTEDSEYSAWSDRGDAIDHAVDCGWLMSGDGHYCDECAPVVTCCNCNGLATTEHEDDAYCDACIAQEVAS